MPKETLLMGIMGSSVAVAVFAVVALLLSIQTAAAQTTMMQEPQQTQQHASYNLMNYSMFNVMGMSMVEDVDITGVSITGNNQVSVNLVYTGNGTSSPSVTVVAMTNHMPMMMMMMNNMMIGGGSIGNMSRGIMTMSPGMMGMSSSMMPPTDMMSSNDAMGMIGSTVSGTQSRMITMMMMPQSQSGSTVINGGWQSGNTVNVPLVGNGSAYDAADLCVMVFPHLT
jgi:hypothetical protein